MKKALLFPSKNLFLLSPLGGQNCPPLVDKRFNKTDGPYLVKKITII